MTLMVILSRGGTQTACGMPRCVERVGVGEIRECVL